MVLIYYGMNKRKLQGLEKILVTPFVYVIRKGEVNRIK